MAWKLYVQLTTRKAALPFDDKYDLVVEIYDSLFDVFQITRELLIDLAPNEFEREEGVATLLLRVLNDGLRPHLTRWQSDFRKWWDEALDAHHGKAPQEIQRQYPYYGELTADLKTTNTELSKFADQLLEIARTSKRKHRRVQKIAPLPPTSQDSQKER